ncbi:MAG: hypothetical protein LBC88_01205 [Spirochaetaceae bacterium]|nr:hypothetical protein [Spirochaetaceae bacterium]
MRALIALCALGIFPPLAADEARRTAFPPLEIDPVSRELAARAQRCSYSWRDLIDMALWASGAEEFPPRNQRTLPTGTSYRDIIAGAVEEMVAARNLPAGPHERGEYILAFLYRRFLKTYSLTQTRLDTLLTTGRYNCVSSAVLYAIFAEAASLEISGVVTRDHAFVTVAAENDYIDVETTNAWGFDPGNRREFQNDFGKVTGFVYVPPGNYRNRVNITPLELVSLIFSNRIAELEKQGNFAAAVPLAMKRAAFLAGRQNPTDSELFAGGERDLQDRLLNYGVSLSVSGRESDALEWAAFVAEWAGGAENSAAGISGAGTGPRWNEFAFAALNNLIVRNLGANRPEAAQENLSRYGGLVSAAERASLESTIMLAGLAARINRRGNDAAALLRDIDAARATGGINQVRAEELRTAVIVNEGSRIAGAEGPLAAAAYLEAAIAGYGENAQLAEALRVHRQNRTVELHNAFARLYNRGSFMAARDQARSALEEFPGNRQLEQDLRLAEDALRRR